MEQAKNENFFKMIIKDRFFITSLFAGALIFFSISLYGLINSDVLGNYFQKEGKKLNTNEKVVDETPTEATIEQKDQPQVKGVETKTNNPSPSLIIKDPIIVGGTANNSTQDNTYLINSLKSKKSTIETLRNESWYNNERSKLENDHTNKINQIKAPYLQKVQYCNTVYSPGSGSAYDACMAIAEQLKLQAEQSLQVENNSYNQKINKLLADWDAFKTWPGIIQNLIIFLEAGNKPDANFWDLYYKIPYV